MQKLPQTFIVFDMEWTAWEGSLARGWSGPGEQREIYDIGAARVEGENFSVIDTFRQLITLELTDTLPAYSTKLTGITQSDLDAGGRPFADAVQQFAQFTDDLQLYCWGHDGDVLAENCQLKAVQNPFDPSRFNNMKEVFKQAGVPADDYYSSTITEYFGQMNKQTAHQGLADALNIVEALRLLRVK